MLLHALGESSPTLGARVKQASQVLDGLPASEQVEVACQLVVGLLAAIQLRFEQTPKERQTFDVLCSDVEEWLQREVAALRFTKAH
jgi:hypothetical protein